MPRSRHISAWWISILIMYVPFVSWSQATFEETYGGVDDDEGFSALEASGGGYLFLGRTFSFGAGESDVYLVRCDCEGQQLWEQTYGGPGKEYGYSLDETDDGGYVLAGWTSSFGAGRDDIYVIRTDGAGDTLWTRTFGGPDTDLGFSVLQTSDGGYAVAGGTKSLGAGSWDICLIKTDEMGDPLWVRTYGGTAEELGSSMVEVGEGGYVITGRTRSFGSGGADLYLVRVDARGDTMWTRTYGGPDDDEGLSVAQTADGGFVVAGRTDSFGGGLTNVYLVKTDAAGEEVWFRTFGGRDVEWGTSVRETSGGGYIVSGRTESFGAGGVDVYLVRADSTGELLWSRTYGGLENDWGFSVSECCDTGYIVAGWTLSFGAGGFDLYGIKTNSEGQLVLVTAGSNQLAPERGCAILAVSPNPFRGSAAIAYALPEAEAVSLRIYDIRGALVRRLVEETVAAGQHEADWDGRDSRGREVSSGVYFCRLAAGDGADTRRVVLIR
jgi:hypothetical protein